MPHLIDQFCEAAREWGRRTGEPEYGIAAWVMGFTGGDLQYEGVGAVDPSAVPEHDRERLTPRQLLGHPTNDQMRDWLTRLVNQLFMDEDFLIVSLIRAVEDKLETWSGVAPLQLDEPTAARGAALYRSDRLRALALDEQRRIGVALETWRALTAPILDPENRKRAVQLRITELGLLE